MCFVAVVTGPSTSTPVGVTSTAYTGTGTTAPPVTTPPPGFPLAPRPKMSHILLLYRTKLTEEAFNQLQLCMLALC